MREKNEGQNLESEFYLLWFIILKSEKRAIKCIKILAQFPQF